MLLRFVRGAAPDGTPSLWQLARRQVVAALAGAPLDSDELAAVSAFVRAGLVSPGDASRARAQLTSVGRYAAG